MLKASRSRLSSAGNRQDARTDIRINSCGKMEQKTEKNEKGFLQKIIGSAKRNHFAQMAICCLLPIMVIVGLQLLGFNGWWIYGLALIACVGSHLVMAFIGFKEEK